MTEIVTCCEYPWIMHMGEDDRTAITHVDSDVWTLLGGIKHWAHDRAFLAYTSDEGDAVRWVAEGIYTIGQEVIR